MCLAIGAVLLIAGYIAYRIGKKQDGAKLAELKAAREEEMDERIRGIHGAVPLAGKNNSMSENNKE